ncbi:MAG TPA: hypothetical protein PKD86_10005, partial [Gemmatales bacterium]|nr:hypothetical protein [Gemmatales bacterium]
AGSVGTDRHSLLVGIPQTQLPVLTPTMPTHIPEIPFAKSTDQKGVAKIAVFAYNRMTGQAVMQSGLHMASSSARDRWLLGLGPFQSGTIRDYTEFAGEPLWFSRGRDEAETAIGPLGPLQANWWEEAPGSPTKPGGSNFACDRAPPPPASADAKPPPTGATPSPQPTVAPASGTVPAAGGPTSVVPAVAPGGSTAPVGPPPLPPPGS